MKTFSHTGSRTRAAWVKTRNPNRQTIWELVVCVVCKNMLMHNFLYIFNLVHKSQTQVAQKKTRMSDHQPLWKFLKLAFYSIFMQISEFKHLLYFFRFCSSAATSVNWGISFKFSSALLKIASATSVRKVLLTMFLDLHSYKQTRETLRLYQK